MEQNYTTSFTVPTSPAATLQAIAQIDQWWAKHCEGSAATVGDIFTVKFEGGDWYKIKVAELAPAQKAVWEVLDAEQTWHDDHKEWAGTKIIFTIEPHDDGSQLTMTHIGLTPDKECYGQCKMGWDYLLQKSLANFLRQGSGLPV